MHITYVRGSVAALRYVMYFRFMDDDVIFAQCCQAARSWTVAEAASRKSVGPDDVGCCKPAAKSAVCDCLVIYYL